MEDVPPLAACCTEFAHKLGNFGGSFCMAGPMWGWVRITRRGGPILLADYHLLLRNSRIGPRRALEDDEVEVAIGMPHAVWKP